MRKYEDGRIGFESGLRKRMYNRLMSNLKVKGYILVGVKSKNRSTIRFEAIKDGRKVNIFGLIRELPSDNAAMNINDYRDVTFDDNTYCILLDRRYLYPMRYNTFKNIKNNIFNSSGNYILIPEIYLVKEL